LREQCILDGVANAVVVAVLRRRVQLPGPIPATRQSLTMRRREDCAWLTWYSHDDRGTGAPRISFARCGTRTFAMLSSLVCSFILRQRLCGGRAG
jgi:hypothetical protein